MHSSLSGNNHLTYEINIFLIYLFLSIISILFSCGFYLYRKKRFELRKLKYLMIPLFFLDFFYLLRGVTFFYYLTPNAVLSEPYIYFLPISIFNLASIFYSLSIVFYALPYLDKETIFELTWPSYLESHQGEVEIGKVVKKGIKRNHFFLSLQDLEKHAFICGATGTGKSNFVQNFLINFKKNYKIPFFLVEFKGEYHFLQRKIENTLILWPGDNFSINIFDPIHSDPLIHAERIFDILKSGQFLDETSEFSPQMEKVLVEILSEVCKSEEKRSWKGFNSCCAEYIKAKRNKIPMLAQTLISIQNRIRRFSQGPLKSLFEKRGSIRLDFLFQHNIILDLSSIIRLGGEKE
ncbi:MAG: DUF87 domain-containing protein, partial [Promethearchaeota archaeon]